MAEFASLMGLYDTTTLVITCAILGLIVGSFLNVVIHRLPIMLMRDWKMQCAELHEQPLPVFEPEVFNLAYPASHCPHCRHVITATENIPILSYLWQKGRCTNCHAPISIRYPSVEAASAVLSAVVAWQFGFSAALGGALVLTWVLLALSMIDIDHYQLPDVLTLPTLWLGILLNLFGIYVDLTASVIGAMVGYMSLWSVYWLFKLATGKEGMGFGDFKLLAVLGAWMGWEAIPAIILLSSVSGAVIGILLIVLAGRGRDVPMPFGPYLACAGWLQLVWGDSFAQWYGLWVASL